MRALLTWAWRDLATDWNRLELEKLGGGAYFFLIALAYLTTDFNAFAEVTGQLWRVGDRPGEVACEYFTDTGVSSIDPQCLKHRASRD